MHAWVRVVNGATTGIAAEDAIIVQSGLKGKGLGWALMQLIIDYAAADGIACRLVVAVLKALSLSTRGRKRCSSGAARRRSSKV